MSHLLITFVGKYMLSGSSSSSTSVDPSALQPFTVSLARLPMVIHRNPSEPCTVSASNLRNYSNYSNGATGDDDDSSDDDDDDNNSSNGRRKKDEWDHYSIHHHSIKQIECSYTESYVLMDDGTVFYVNFFRSSSDGDDMSTERRKMPQLVMLHPLLFGGKRIEKLSGGYSRIFFLTVCGELYVQSDDNTYSQCGNHVARDFRGYSKVPNYDLAKCASSATVPAAYSSQEEGDDDASGCSTDMKALLSLSPSSPYAITHAACSYSFSTFVVNDKHLFGLGQNWILVNSPASYPFHIPLPLEEGEHIETLTAGSFHVMVLTTHGRLFTLGERGAKSIVHREGNEHYALVDVGEPVKMVKCKYDYTIVVTQSNQVLVFGLSNNSTLLMTEDEEEPLGVRGDFDVPRGSRLQHNKLFFRVKPNVIVDPVMHIAMSRKAFYLSTRNATFAVGSNENGLLNVGSSPVANVTFHDHVVLVNNYPQPVSASSMCEVACGENMTALFMRRTESLRAIRMVENLWRFQTRGQMADCSIVCETATTGDGNELYTYYNPS